jgi:Arc/MetJ family transcription regulator
MWKKVEIEVDSDLVQEAISRYRLAHAREAVHLAPRTLSTTSSVTSVRGNLADATKRGDAQTMETS